LKANDEGHEGWMKARCECSDRRDRSVVRERTSPHFEKREMWGTRKDCGIANIGKLRNLSA
jgi:hypothetical protein